MAKTAAERMADLRLRQREAGLVTLTIVVPKIEVARFATLARRRRRRWQDGPRRAARSLRFPENWADNVGRSAIRPRDITRLRELLEVAAVRLVVGRLNTSIERRLLAILDSDRKLNGDATGADLQRLHAALGALSGDTTLDFLLEVALRLTDDHASFTRRPRRDRELVVARIQREHASIVDAILQRDANGAERRVRRYLAGLRAWLD